MNDEAGETLAMKIEGLSLSFLDSLTLTLLGEDLSFTDTQSNL